MVHRHSGCEDRRNALVNSLKNWDKMSDAKYGSPWPNYMERSKYRFIDVAKSIDCSQGAVRILDIGPTVFTLMIKETFPHYEVWTVDLTNDWESRCKAAGVNFIQGNVEKGRMPFEDNYFNIVIFTEVLEHLLAVPNTILEEVRRIMLPHGKLILSVPNIAALYQRIRLFWGISPIPYAAKQKVQDLHVEHVHEYTMREIVRILEACNFAIVTKKYVRANILGEKTISRIAGKVYESVTFFVPQFRSTIYIECYKAETKGVTPVVLSPP